MAYKVQMVRGYPVRTNNKATEERIVRRRSQAVQTGMRFNLLTTVEDIGTIINVNRPGTNKPHSRKRVWGCVCDCGTKIGCDESALVRGFVKNCGCQRGVLRTTGPWTAGLNEVLSGYKRNAKKRNLDWLLSNEEFFHLVNASCFYCGGSPNNHISTTSKKSSATYNGIDRIDNKKGYIDGNVVSCCKLCNLAKRDMDVNDFLKWARAVAANAPKYIF